MDMEIPNAKQVRDSIEKLLGSTRYDGKGPPKDSYGLPAVKPDPDDPDDE